MDGEENESLGELIVWDGLKRIFECKTLELPDKENQKNISRIPEGSYWCAPRKSKKHGDHFHILNVEGRSLVLFHTLNRYTQTRGCIGVGTSFSHIDDDGILDVIWSQHTLDKMVKLFPEGFRVFIIDMDK